MAGYRYLPPPVLDRVVGTLVGLATGDALGAGYEFAAPPVAKAAMIGGGLGAWAPGEWTDDTQQAICVAESAASGALDAGAVGQSFLAWFADDPKDVGNQTRAVLEAAHTGSDLHTVSQSYFEHHPDGAAGNGSLMRTAPVALAHLGDDETIVAAALEISALTHADPLAGEACAIWCIAIDRAVRERRLDGIWDGVDLLPGDAQTRWAGWLLAAETRPASTFAPNGFVVGALQAAWAAIRQTPIPAEEPCRHLQDALHAAVCIGHDTDTVAAIAGSSSAHAGVPPRSPSPGRRSCTAGPGWRPATSSAWRCCRSARAPTTRSDGRAHPMSPPGTASTTTSGRSTSRFPTTLASGSATHLRRRRWSPTWSSRSVGWAPVPRRAQEPSTS